MGRALGKTVCKLEKLGLCYAWLEFRLGCVESGAVSRESLLSGVSFWPV
jgi:hypothetical protein